MMAQKERVTPVEKVLELLHGMLEKAKKEKHEEMMQFAAYKQFCDDTIAKKKEEIAAAEEKIEQLVAEMEKLEAYILQLTKDIKKLLEDVATWEAEIKAATETRAKEKADYDALHQDYSESVDALQRAIAVLKEQAKDVAGSDKTVGEFGKVSLAQVSDLKNLKLIPDDAKQTIDSFLAQDPDAGLAVTAPEANAYEFQSHGVIEMLEKLLDKFMGELNDLIKKEKNAVQAFEMMVMDLKAQIAQAEQEVSEKTTLKAKKKEALAVAAADLEETKAMKVADEKYLADLMAECEQKAADFAARQKLRAEEIEAIEKAIEIISSAAVQGNAEKHLPTLVQSAAASLAQLRAEAQSPTQMLVAKYLQDKASELKSRVLSTLAVRVMEDPFRKVKKMIKDLITKLMEEAAEEADHKGWCDTELSTNEQTRKEKTAMVETLMAEIDQLEADIAKLTEEIAELTKAIAELDAAMAKATAIRQAEKAKNAETIDDAKEAQTAVAQALVILKDFYEKAGEATALIQQKPPIFDEPYKGLQSESGGVIGMLEVIESDFARLEADTKAAEEMAQKAYDEFMTDSEVDKAAKVADMEHKTAKKQDTEQVLTTKKEDMAGTQKELDAANAYYDKLKPSCVTVAVSYDDRVAQRKAEIQSLQEAYKILNGEDIP